MKTLIYLTLVLFTTNHIFAQTNTDEHKWKATVKVVDESGTPVAKANVKVGYYVKNTSVDIEGMTDANGVFIADHTTSTFNYVEYTLAFVIEKEGYYGTRSKCDLGLPYEASKWNPTVTLVLKKAGKPIAMYAKWVNTHVPDLDKPIGYDFTSGDWVGSYGKGVSADILFTGHFDKRADGESDFTLTVSFPKLGDGIQEFLPTSADKSSGLLSPHEAPADGYQSKWVQTDNRKPGKPIETNRDENRNYIFRVRTVLDHNGNVVSAHYGKIYGDFMKFTYYLNPTPNSRNIEFDPKQDLLGGLQPVEQVTAP